MAGENEALLEFRQNALAMDVLEMDFSKRAQATVSRRVLEALFIRYAGKDGCDIAEQAARRVLAGARQPPCDARHAPEGVQKGPGRSSRRIDLNLFAARL